MSVTAHLCVLLRGPYPLLCMPPNTAFLRDNYSFLHYERLTDNMSGRSSVRIMNGRVERLIFTESEEGIEIEILELNTTRYGNKK